MPASSTTRNFRLAALALAALLAIGAGAGAAASGGTPTPEPTPTASPTPYPQSTITVRFFADPELTVPIELILDGPIYRLLADGAVCLPPDDEIEEFIASGYTVDWPLVGNLPQACTKGPPTILTFEFRPPSENAEILGVEVEWNGDDIIVDKWVSGGEADPVSPTPQLTSPNTSPASLPAGGGAQNPPDSLSLTLAAVGSVFTLISVVAVAAARHHSHRRATK